MTTLPMLSPLISIHCLQHCTYAVTGVQNTMTHLAYNHINGSFFIHSYTKTKITGSMQGHPDQYPETQHVKTSHSGVAGHPSLLIFLFKKQFPSLGFVPCTQCLGILPLPRTPTQDLTTKVLGPSRYVPNHMPTAHGKPYSMYHYCSTQNPSHRMANW